MAHPQREGKIMRYNTLHDILTRAGYRLVSDGHASGRYPYGYEYRRRPCDPDIYVIAGRTGRRQPGAVWRVFYGDIVVYWPREGINKLDQFIMELEEVQS
jgi:hypothetical protein